MTRFPYTISGVMPGDQARHIEQLGEVVDDLRRYAETGGPTAAELSAAPLITAWSLIPDFSAARLFGHVDGHPVVGPGPGVSSRLVAIDTNAGWARTWSRVWRLGPPITVLRHH